MSRKRSRRTGAFKAPKLHFHGLDVPIGSDACSIHESLVPSWTKHEEMHDDARYPHLRIDKYADHIKVDFVPGNPGRIESWEPSVRHCGKHEWQTLSKLVAPLPFTLAFLSDATVAPPPNPSRSDVADRLVNPFGNNFFESLASVKSIGGLADDLGKLRLALAKASRKVKRIPHKGDALRRLGATVRGSASAYLASEFGWQQAGEDVARLLAFAKPMLENMEKLKKREGKVVRVGFKAEHPISLRGDGWSISGTATTRLTYRLQYRYTPSGISQSSPLVSRALKNVTMMADFWGLAPSASRAWDLVPASWLIDQVLPIGDLLDDLGNNTSLAEHTMQVTYLGGSSSSSFTGSISYRYDYWRSNQGATDSYWKIPEPVWYNAKVSHFRRTPQTSPPPLFSVRRRKVSISPTGVTFLGLLASKK